LYPYSSEDKKEQIMRKGQFAHYNTADANVIICHGFSCNHHDVSVLRFIFDSGKYNVLNFDFRAHGDLVEQDGKKHCCTFGKDEVLDLSAAIDFIRQYPDKKVSEKPVFLYGFSMGAAVAIETAARYMDSIKGLVLDCPFDSSYGVVKRGLNEVKFEVLGYQFSLPGIHWLKQYAFHPYVQSVLKPILKLVAHFDTQNIETDLQPISPIKSIKDIDVPILFIHCKKDEKIPLKVVMKLYEKAPGPKRLWVTGGQKHFGSFFHSPETYTVVVQNFINDSLSDKQNRADSVREKIVFDEEGKLNNSELVSQLGF
jgi:pimeloyl-ACP methyl ester carboxylesterase